MALVWQPDPILATQLCELLAQFQRPGAHHAQIHQQLEQAKHAPDFNNYLSFIFSKGDQLPLEVRQSAGLVLKNNLRTQYQDTSEDFRNYIKGDVLHVLSHPERVMRTTAGTLVTTIVGATGLATWPELVMVLGGGLSSSDASTVHGVLDTLAKIVEDHPEQMEVKLTGASWGGGQDEQPVSCLLVGPLLAVTSHVSAKVRAQALEIVNLMAPHMPTGLHDQLEVWTQRLFALATDSDPTVRKEVVKGMVGLLSLMPHLLMPQMKDVIEYMLAMNQDAHEEVAVEAAEFWMTFCDVDMDLQLLQPVLGRLIPVLLKNMVFEEEDEEVQDAEAAEEAPDGPDSSQLAPSRRQKADDQPPGMVEEGEEAEEDDGEAVRSWNLRKCSAAALDMLSNNYEDQDLLPLMLPIVQQNLDQQQDWRLRESAILALGAVSEGCHMGMASYIEGLIQMLLPRLKDERPMVRVIACWTLGRYVPMLLMPPGGPPPNPHAAPPAIAPAVAALFDAVLAGLLERVVERNRYVQEAACSALAEVLDELGRTRRIDLLLPRLQMLVDAMAHALGHYQRRNLRVLLDALSTTTSVIGPAWQEPAAAQLGQRLVPPLFQRWQRLPLWDREGAPCMDGLATLSGALRAGFEPFAAAVFQRAVTALQWAQQAKQSGRQGAESYDIDLHMSSLDLLAGLAVGLKASLDPLLASHPLVQPLIAACGDEANGVRQSGFALLGDLARGCPGHVLGVLPQAAKLAMANLEAPMLTEDNMAACNNATWALGELMLQAQPAMLEPVALGAAETMAFVLGGGVRVTPSLRQNAAITLGRLAVKVPQLVAPHLGHFCRPWCRTLRTLYDDMEKESAYAGLVAVLRINPEPAVQCFADLAGAICSWRFVQDERLRGDMAQLLQAYKASMSSSGQWQPALAAMEPALVQKLQQLCGA